MACLTRNPASARHAATADQSNALLRIITSLLYDYYMNITWLLQMGNHVIMIPLCRVMQRVSIYYYTIFLYYYVIITPGSIITHYYLFQSPELADEQTSTILMNYNSIMTLTFMMMMLFYTCIHNSSMRVQSKYGRRVNLYGAPGKEWLKKNSLPKFTFSLHQFRV